VGGGGGLRLGSIRKDQLEEDWKRIGFTTPNGGSLRGGDPATRFDTTRTRTGIDTSDAASDVSSGFQVNCSLLDPIEEGVASTPAQSKLNTPPMISNNTVTGPFESNDRGVEVDTVDDQVFNDSDQTVDKATDQTGTDTGDQEVVPRTGSVAVTKAHDIVYHL